MGSRNKRKARWTWLIVISSVILLIALSVISFLVLSGRGFAFHGRFKSVNAGMSRAEVITLLGEADEKSNSFRLGQYEAFEHEYERAKRSNSEYYLVWHRGIDVVYTVGFDAEDEATITAVGGT